MVCAALKPGNSSKSRFPDGLSMSSLDGFLVKHMSQGSLSVPFRSVTSQNI